MTGQALTLSGVVSMIFYVVKTLVSVAYVIGIGMIVYAGFKMATSHGDAGKFKEARMLLWYAIIGLVVMFGANLIVNTIQNFATSPSNVIQ